MTQASIKSKGPAKSRSDPCEGTVTVVSKNPTLSKNPLGKPNTDVQWSQTAGGEEHCEILGCWTRQRSVGPVHSGLLEMNIL